MYNLEISAYAIILFMFVDMVKPGVGMWGECDLTGLVDPML
jgi:hypothetical protein